MNSVQNKFLQAQNLVFTIGASIGLSVLVAGCGSNKPAMEAKTPPPVSAAPQAAPAPVAAPAPAPVATSTSSTTNAAALRPVTNLQEAQKRLNAMGYEAGVADGRKGPQTRAALQRFQAAVGLPQSGELDRATASALSR